MSSKLPGLLFANRIIGSLTTKSFAECVTVFPVILRLPVINTSPEIVPPVELYFVFDDVNALCARVVPVLA